jgi:hypothetical protein
VTRRLRQNAGAIALGISVLSLFLSVSGLAGAASTALFGASAVPRPHRLLLLGRNSKFPASAIPTVANSRLVGGRSVHALTPSCPSDTVDFVSWCLDENIYQVPPSSAGNNNYFWATQACARRGGYLPSAAQLIGAAARDSLESVLTDNPKTAIVDTEPSDGLKDQREMSATLVTTSAGSSAAGSEGVSVGATGDPRTGQPNPTPQPANPDPDTLQYVTVYDNGNRGGFAGSEPVSNAENFRCAYNKTVQPVSSQARSR